MTALAARLIAYDRIQDVPLDERRAIATLAVHMVRDGQWTKLYAATALHDLGMCASPEKVGAAANTSGPTSVAADQAPGRYLPGARGGGVVSVSPKFRARCVECGKSSPRATTGYTQGKWMTKHEAECPGRDPRPAVGTYWTNDGWVTEYEQVSS